jgi:tetratricopeptide (TPR) repeat protein
MATLGLGMIVKDELKEFEQIMKSVYDYVDAIFLTVTSEERLEEFEELIDSYPKLKVSYFHWVADFAKARNYNLKQITTDYWFWLDSDDTIQHADFLPEMVAKMVKEDLDVIFWPYNYAQNESGECMALHDRERLIKRDHPFTWRGAVHETLIGDSPKGDYDDRIVVKHNKLESEIGISSERNHKILLREYKKTKDPRTMHYLGLSYYGLRKYDKAIEKFLEHIQASGWDEERYRSWCKIAEIHIITENLDKAHAAASAAIDLLPSYPDAYFIKAQICYGREEWDQTIEWMKTAMSKPKPRTFSVVDPSTEIRCLVYAAVSYMHLLDTVNAYETLLEALRRSPNNKDAMYWYPLMKFNYSEDMAIKDLDELADFLKNNKGDVEKLFQSLPSDLAFDGRVAKIKQKYLKAKNWNDKSIVFFCGPTNEVWGPDTLASGMGGSEEAVTYLARELALLGWEVTVYNERDDEYIDMIEHTTDYVDGELQEGGVAVKYLPWNTINTMDRFNTLVVWRAPELADSFDAKQIVVDLHDTIQPERVEKVVDKVDKFFVKSSYHRSLYPNVDDDMFVIVGNGILRSQFNDN